MYLGFVKNVYNKENIFYERVSLERKRDTYSDSNLHVSKKEIRYKKNVGF
jgi:hypothetical protein